MGEKYMKACHIYGFLENDQYWIEKHDTAVCYLFLKVTQEHFRRYNYNVRSIKFTVFGILKNKI